MSTKHLRYVWYALIAALTTVSCLIGIVAHANQMCCLKLSELNTRYFRELYVIICGQVGWMGLALVIELLVPQVNTNELPAECRDV